MEHSFDVEFARKHGLPAAILWRNFQFWILHNKANGKYQIQKRTWTYCSIKALHIQFFYLSMWEIRKALDYLLVMEMLVEGNHNSTGMDRTRWFAFVDEKTALEAIPAHLWNSQMGNQAKNEEKKGKNAVSSEKRPFVPPTNAIAPPTNAIAPPTNAFAPHTNPFVESANGTNKEEDNLVDNLVDEKKDKKDFSQKGLSEEAFWLLRRYGVRENVAKNIIFQQLVPAESIREAIKNGLAKQKSEKGFELRAGYIVEAIKRARAEGKVIGPTKASRKLAGEIRQTAKKISQRRHELTPLEIQNRKQMIMDQIAQMQAGKL